MKNKRRSPIIALLLSIVTPGLGQVYNGQLRRGIIFYLVCLFLPIFLLIMGLHYKFYGIIILLVVPICFYLFIIGDALFAAIKIKEIVLKAYNRWYFYLIFAMVTISIYTITGNEFKTDIFEIKAYKISSGAMAPTLLLGDQICVSLKYYKTNKPQRGDIIVFKYPEDPRIDFIRRVIATEGEVIESRNEQIYINGRHINEPYVQHTDNSILPGRDNFGPYLVPKNKYYVLGDNRDQSYDSRHLGFIEIDTIKGKVLYIYWSQNKRRIGIEMK